MNISRKSTLPNILIKFLFILYVTVLIIISLIILSLFGYSFKKVQKFPFIVLSKRVLGVSVARLAKESITKPSDANLPHFYEWTANFKDKYYMPWSQEEIYLTTNSDGLRDRYNYSVNKNPKTYRIIALGDSFTEGPYVKVEDSYPEQLEDELNNKIHCPGIDKLEVLNFGVGGYDIEYAAQRFITRGLKYQPDLILWFLKDDDFNELAEMAKERTDKYIASLSETQKADLTTWSKYSQIPEDLRNEKINLEDKIYYLVREELLQELDNKQFFQIQTKAVEKVARSTQNTVVFFTFNFTKPEYKMRMKLWANTEPNVLFFDGVRNIYELGASYRPSDEHPNKEGYNIIAEDIFSYLVNNVIKCD